MSLKNYLFLFTKTNQQSYDIEDIFLIIATLFLATFLAIICYFLFSFWKWKYKKKYLIFINWKLFYKFLRFFVIFIFLFLCSLLSYFFVLDYHQNLYSIYIVIFFYLSFFSFFIFAILTIIYFENNCKSLILGFGVKSLFLLNLKINYFLIKNITFQETKIKILCLENTFIKKIIFNFNNQQMMEIKKTISKFKIKINKN